MCRMDPTADHARRIENMIRSGTIHEIDHGEKGKSPARVRVKTGNLITDWLPWGAQRAGKTKKWSPPTIGEQVGLISPDGDTTKAMLMPGGFYQDASDTPSNSPDKDVTLYPDEAREEYDHKKSEYRFKLPDGGKFYFEVGETLLEIRGDGVTLTTPNFTINGEVIQSGGIMSSNEVIVDSHIHKKVMAGMGVSGPPVVGEDE